MGLQLGDMEDIVNTCKASLQVKLVCSLAYALADLERAHKPLTKLMYSRQMQVTGAQQHSVPNLMLLVPMVAVVVLLLVLLGFLQVRDGILVLCKKTRPRVQNFAKRIDRRTDLGRGSRFLVSRDQGPTLVGWD